MIRWQSVVAAEGGVASLPVGQYVHRDDDRGLYVLASGGPGSGDDGPAAIATVAALQTLATCVARQCSAATVRLAIRDAFRRANAALLDRACLSPWYSRPQVWMTVLVVRDDWAVVGRVGAHQVTRMRGRTLRRVGGDSPSGACLGSVDAPICSGSTTQLLENDRLILADSGLLEETLSPLIDPSCDSAGLPDALIAGAGWRGALGAMTAIVVHGSEQDAAASQWRRQRQAI